jgi:hypothetical protein
MQIVIASAAIGALAQNGSQPAERNVEILSHKWSRIVILQDPYRADRPNFDPSSSSPQVRDARTSRGTRYAYEAKVKNTGDKSIRAITWDYVFTDADSHKEVDRRRFHSAVSIDPRKTKKLEGYTRSAPTATVSANGLQTEQVIVECLVFSDGSTWRRASYTGPCPGNRK